MWMDAENKVGDLSEKKRWMDGEWSHNSSLREKVCAGYSSKSKSGGSSSRKDV